MDSFLPTPGIARNPRDETRWRKMNLSVDLGGRGSLRKARRNEAKGSLGKGWTSRSWTDGRKGWKRTILAQGSNGSDEVQVKPGVYEGRWKWREHVVRYQRVPCANEDVLDPPLLLIHGFGGNCDHWSECLLPLGSSQDTYALDLLGFGYSDKPDPNLHGSERLYSFENWGQQIVDFCEEFFDGRECLLICNSVGGIAGLQAAVYAPHRVIGVALLNISMRGLHVSKQPPLARPFVRAFQDLLRNTFLGEYFFKSVATAKGVENILKQAYFDPETVTPEVVQKILRPGLQEGASKVFLDFISYSTGPLPETLLPHVECPVWIIWGSEDPWEPVREARQYKEFGCVKEFIELKGVGHCPQDEAPHLVVPILKDFSTQCATRNELRPSQ